MAKMFVTYNGTRSQFTTDTRNLPTLYNDKIVFIKGSTNGADGGIYTHGTYFASLPELISALNYVKGIKVGGTTYNAAAGGGYVAFEAIEEQSAVTVNADSTGIKIGLHSNFIKKVDDVIALVSTINNDYLKSADKTALTNLINAADALAQSALDKADEVAEDVGNVEDLETNNKEVVKAINEVLTAIGTGGTASVVSITEKGATTDYAQVYEFKQGSTTIGIINIPKELVVSGGEIVTNPSGQPAGTYIKLTLQNVADPLYIDVAKLVDVYTAQQSATQVQLSIDASNVISATIVAGSIGATELAADAVTTVKILDKNVTKAKLAQAVQESLTKADNAAPQATTYNKDEVDAFITGITTGTSLSNYYTKTEVDAMWEWEELN